MTNDPILLTPGPLTTTPEVRQAMLRDWGSWDADFRAITKRVRARLLAVANADGTHEVVPIQGSGTFLVEAAIGSLVPRGGRMLALVNGAYGQRIVKTARVLGIDTVVYETAEDTQPDPGEVSRLLGDDPAISHVVMVHCETTSGILNPLPGIARAVSEAGRRLIVDAMSTFGALPTDAAEIAYDAVISSANKCLEGVPGAGFVVVRRSALEESAGQARSLSLDLHDQWSYMEKTGQWRFTPPTHVVAALDAALAAHEAEGGVVARGIRYRANHRALVDGLAAVGIKALIPDDLQAPIITTFHSPDDPSFDFGDFYNRIKAKGFIIYPGKMTVAETFRVGCIGSIGPDSLRAAVAAIDAALTEMGVVNRAPAPSEPAAA